jgi:transposase
MGGAGSMADVWLSAQPAATADGHGPEVGTELSLVRGGGEHPLTTGPQVVSEAGRRTEALNPPPPRKPSRRRFTAEYKLRILHEADQCAKPGELGALLRREGLYSSHLCAWRRQREAGVRAALTPKKRGRKPAKRGSLARQNQLLQRETRHLRARLHQAEMIIAMQARVSDILGITPETPDARPAQCISSETAPHLDHPEPNGNHRGQDI